MLANVKNSFNGLQFGFGYAAESIAIALAAHGPSAVYGYSDYLWQKYRLGDFFATDAKARTLTSNVYLDAKRALDTTASPTIEGHVSGCVRSRCCSAAA